MRGEIRLRICPRSCHKVEDISGKGISLSFSEPKFKWVNFVDNFSAVCVKFHIKRAPVQGHVMWC